MLKKYYAYLGKNGTWSVKRYMDKTNFMYLVKECLKPDSLIRAYVFPFEVNVTREEWYIPKDRKNHPALIEFVRLMSENLRIDFESVTYLG